MNQYICGDLVDLKRYNKYIWCYYVTDDIFQDAPSADLCLWSLKRKRLVEMIRANFILENLNDDMKENLSKDEFKEVVEEFKKMMLFFESNDHVAKFLFEPFGECHHIRKIKIE